MKFYKMLFSVLILALFLSVSTFAQEEQEEMSEEEWQTEMDRLTGKKGEAQADLDELQQEVNELKVKLENIQTYEDCMDELYAMVGATEADVDNFRMRVNKLQSQVSGKVEPKEDRAAELKELQASKISALPEFYQKVHETIPQMMDAWVVKPKHQMYTVKKGDHLWGIAKMDKHYGNPFAWPQIYNANKDQINDPDLIYPDQEFKVPALTDQEKEKYNKVYRNWKGSPTN